MIKPGQDLSLAGRSFDLVISCATMERNTFWKETISNALGLMTREGLFVMSCATLGRPRHGTSDAGPTASPHTTDYYENLEADDIRRAIDLFEYSLRQRNVFGRVKAHHELEPLPEKG